MGSHFPARDTRVESSTTSILLAGRSGMVVLTHCNLEKDIWFVIRFTKKYRSGSQECSLSMGKVSSLLTANLFDLLNGR